MKLKILSMLVILGILSVIPMIYMGRFDPMAFFSAGLDSRMAEFKKLQAKAPKNLSNVVTDKKVQVYQWRDKNGIMQYSNTPPPDMQARQVTLDPDHNVIQATSIPPQEEKQAPVADTVERPYSIQGMQKVVNDAKDVEKLLKQRHERQQKAINHL